MEWTDETNRRFYMQTGHKIRQARLQADWNQQDLATAVGLTRSSIANMEAGRQRPPLHTVALIAATLHTSIEALLPQIAEVDNSAAAIAQKINLDGQATAAQDFVTNAIQLAAGRSDVER